MHQRLTSLSLSINSIFNPENRSKERKKQPFFFLLFFWSLHDFVSMFVNFASDLAEIYHSPRSYTLGMS